MGLMYLFPVSEEETTQITIEESTQDQKKITLRSYGLPLLFWGYYGVSFVVLIGLYLAIAAPLEKLWASSENLDKLLALATYLVLFGVPFGFLSFFFYEKSLTKSGLQIQITHKLFGLPVRRQSIHLRDNQAFTIDHFMDSPNMARLANKEELRGYQNKGYFELFVTTKDSKQVMIDRHSRKVDLAKITQLLQRY